MRGKGVYVLPLLVVLVIIGMFIHFKLQHPEIRWLTIAQAAGPFLGGCVAIICLVASRIRQDRIDQPILESTKREGVVKNVQEIRDLVDQYVRVTGQYPRSVHDVLLASAVSAMGEPRATLTNPYSQKSTYVYDGHDPRLIRYRPKPGDIAYFRQDRPIERVVGFIRTEVRIIGYGRKGEKVMVEALVPVTIEV